MPPIPLAEWLRMGEADIAAFKARMREVIPTYQPGDRLELNGEVFEVTSYQRQDTAGYWLRGRDEVIFIPVDWEDHFRGPH